MGEVRKQGPRLLGDLILELMKKTARPRRKAMIGVPDAAASMATRELVSSTRLVINTAWDSRNNRRF